MRKWSVRSSTRCVSGWWVTGMPGHMERAGGHVSRVFLRDLGVTCFYLCCYKDANENYTMVPAGVHPSIKLHLQIHLAT